MPTLHELQRAMAESLIARNDRVIAPHIIEGGIPVGGRLAVYRNTMIGGLTTALRLAYPAVYRLVGAAFFESAAQLFMAEHPPVNACLDDYHPAFADFLGDFGPAAALPYLAGVARLDWAASRALHAADVPPLDPRRLAAIPADRLDHVRLVPNPSVSLLRAEHPVDAIWHAVLAQDDAAMTAIDLDAGPVRFLVQRRDDAPAVTRLDEAAWSVATALCAGRSLPDTLGDADGIDAPALLASLLTEGVFTDFAVAPETGSLARENTI